MAADDGVSVELLLVAAGGGGSSLHPGADEQLKSAGGGLSPVGPGTSAPATDNTTAGRTCTVTVLK